MATNQKQERNLAADPGCIDADLLKNSKDQPLPSDMLSDLRDSFEFFAKGASHISRVDLESIIHNFGFNRITQRDKETDLRKVDK